MKYFVLFLVFFIAFFTAKADFTFDCSDKNRCAAPLGCSFQRNGLSLSQWKYVCENRNMKCEYHYNCPKGYECIFSSINSGTCQIV